MNKLICATPLLGRLDRKLAQDFAATKAQGGIDARALQKSEDEWLRSVRGACHAVPCLEQAYLARDAAILDQSLRAASPAAYDDTRPFAAPVAAWQAARALLGRPLPGGPAVPPAGASKIAGFQPIAARDAYVVPWRLGGGNFAFLLSCPEASPSACRVSDMVALPLQPPGLSFMQCHLDTDSHGFGLREPGGRTLAYWSIDEARGTIQREPIHVTGEQDLRCQPPETGE